MPPGYPRDTVFVLFGVTGDLAGRKIVPSLFNLFREKRLPQHFRLLGVGRRPMDTGALVDHLRQRAEWADRDPEAWDAFAATVDYRHADAADPSAYAELGRTIAGLAEQWGARPDCVFYMATPPSLFIPITDGLGEAGLSGERSRIVVEKPIGHDLDSMRDINNALHRHFVEKQVFRIDHFLGKETVQNILALRFANPMFEPVWDRTCIDHVAITVAETLGVERRGGYYEMAGALRDMVQNHLLQLLCLVAMEPPASYEAQDIHARKIDVLRAIRPIPGDAVDRFAARGQYAGGWMNGRELVPYREEPAVDSRSNRETYAALKLHVDNWRWQGVPFYLRTGKRMAADVSEISIRFGQVPHQSFPASAITDVGPARLVIQLQPEQGIVLKFIAKEPGYDMRLRPASMRFCYQDAFATPPPEAYATLLWDVLTDESMLFMSAEQVERAWEILTPVLNHWDSRPASDFPNYAAGSWGPESGELLVARDGRGWLTPTVEYIGKGSGCRGGD